MPDENQDDMHDTGNIVQSSGENRPRRDHSLSKVPEIKDTLRNESKTICELFPFLKVNSVYEKLSNHKIFPNYKAIVLEFYIELAIEKGYEVSDLVFQKLEEWLKETVPTLAVGADSTAPPFKNPDNTSLKPGDKYMFSNILDLCTNDIESSSTDQESSLSQKQCDNQVKNIVSANSENLAELMHREVIDTNKHCTTLTEELCEIVDIVKGKPSVIELDDEPDPSYSSDILVIEEYDKYKDDDVIIDYNQASTAMPSTSYINIKGDNTSIKTANLEGLDLETETATTFENVGDLESDPLLWTEAETICTLLSFLQLNNVHQSLLDNYYHPYRKSKVLAEYIELALEEGYEITDAAFEMLNCWQKLQRKRPNRNVMDDEVSGTKKRKAIGNLVSESTHNIIPVNHMVEIPMEQNIPSSSSQIHSSAVPDVSSSAQFSNLSEEERAWYISKLKLLSEIVPNLSQEYMLSQILLCQTETEITDVVGRLIEESSQTASFMPVPEVSNEQEMEVGGEASTSLVPQDPTVASTSADGADATNSGVASTSTDEPTHNQSLVVDSEDRIQAHIQQLGEMFSDADPDFLAERANEVAGEHERFVELVVELTENRSYPKMEEYLKRQQKLEMRKKFIEGMSVEEFLEYFEDPEKVFCDTTKVMSILYITNAKAQLLKDLPYHLSKVVETIFRSNNYHYLPTLRTLRLEKGTRKTKRAVGGKQPGDLDDIFLKELCYAKMEAKIEEYLKRKEEQRILNFEQAKAKGELQECQCCFDDEVLRSDMSPCERTENAHYFCNSCIKRYSEEQIGQGKHDFLCLEGDCKSPFSLNTLKRLLKPSIFSNLLKRKQAEEIAAAGIEDLESCPFCNFATIMPNKEDKVFKCLNPECLKDSCRLCKEPNHIPLRCEEVEKKKQIDARTYLENEMSEAVVRECYKCKKRFIKEEGCNKMLCSCGAMMCYLCKKPIKGYDHFATDGRNMNKKQDKCPLWSNSLKLHAEEVQQRAAEAKQKIDPSVQLLHDPTKDLPQVPDYLKKPTNGNINNPRMRIDVQNFQRVEHFIGNNIPRLVAQILHENRQRIQRHSHQHRHTHFYIPMPHFAPPPPAHQQQHEPPYRPLNVVAPLPPEPNFRPLNLVPYHQRMDQGMPLFPPRAPPHHHLPPPFLQPMDHPPHFQPPPRPIPPPPPPYHQRVDPPPHLPPYHHQQHHMPAPQPNPLFRPPLHYYPPMNPPQQPLPPPQHLVYPHRQRAQRHANHHQPPQFPPNGSQHGNINHRYQYGN